MENLLEQVQALAGEMASWRRELHRMPETGMRLPKTAAFVQGKLTDMDVECELLLDGSCVVGRIGHGEPCILLRADMDALPVTEESGEPFAAENGCMHACGHDMHAAALLGAAQILKSREGELPGTVKLLFQPGEETFEGALGAIGAGVLENPRVDAAVAAHVISQQPQGVIACNSQASLSGVYAFRITVQGRGGHGSMPEACADPITAAVHIHLGLQELMAREVPAKANTVLTVGSLRAGDVPNVIPDNAVLEGTLRFFDPALRDVLVERIAQVAQGVSAVYRSSASVEALSDVPPLICDREMAALCREAVADALPSTAVVEGEPAMASEDFAFIAQRVPSAYFMVGAAAADGQTFPQHNPHVRFAEEALVPAAVAYVACVESWFNKNV